MSTKYTPEFRTEAVDYVLSTGKSVASISAELGICEKTLYRWVKVRKDKLDKESGKTVVDAQSPELREAQKRIRELEMENEFLKKATAFFAKNQA